VLSVRFGIIGCGAIGPTHAEAIAKIDGSELAGVCDIVGERASKLGDKFGVPAFTTLKPLFARCDAVCLCIPSGYHAQIGAKAATAGKHVVCEKPVDVSYRNAERLIKTCREKKVKLTVISQHRFANAIQEVRNAAQNGGLGKLISGDMFNPWYRTQAYYDSGDWRGTWKLDGGGCLMNQGVHYVDMLQWIMGGVKSVQAIMRTATHNIEVEDLAYALIEFKNGAIGMIHGSTASYPGFAERLEIHGAYGTAIIEGDRIKAWHVDPEAPNDSSPYGKGVMKQPTPNLHTHDAEEKQGTGASDPTAIWGEQHRLQLADFVEAIQTCRDPFITGEMALQPLKVILAIYRSARLGGKKVEVG
jgi:UDP-N-acetyl-2-amino-2-deoxyglucuronate dehydrogenase